MSMRIETQTGERHLTGASTGAYSDLLKESESFVAGIDLEALGELGISRSLETKFWPAHTIVTYPYFNDLESNTNIAGTLLQIQQAEVSHANIYVHIPFCTGICEYCAYARVAGRNEQQVSEYLNALKQELEIWKRLFNGRLPSASSLYIGGGTPTSIPTQAFEHLLEMLAEYFGLSQNCNFECTCEVSPETVADADGRTKLNLLKSWGVSRISMGVQSFSDKLASEINRRHTESTVIRAIDNIRQTGIDNLNIDLMYGLPGQDLDVWVDSLATAVGLELPSITLHQLKLKSKSLLATPKKLIKTAGWSQEKSLLFGFLGKRILQQEGYTQLGVYRFVRDKDVAVHHYGKNYRMSNLLGLGSSSYSFLGNCTTYNIFNQDAYKTNVCDGKLPLGVGRPLSGAELRARFVIFGIRIGISEADFQEEFPENHFGKMADYFPLIETLRDRGLIERISGAKDRLSTIGLLFANEIGMLLASTQSRGSI